MILNGFALSTLHHPFTCLISSHNHQATYSYIFNTSTMSQDQLQLLFMVSLFHLWITQLYAWFSHIIISSNTALLIVYYLHHITKSISTFCNGFVLPYVGHMAHLNSVFDEFSLPTLRHKAYFNYFFFFMDLLYHFVFESLL